MIAADFPHERHFFDLYSGPDELSRQFREDIAIWLRVHVSRDWQADSEALFPLADRLARVAFAHPAASDPTESS